MKYNGFFRSVTPALYNDKRLREKPLPSTIARNHMRLQASGRASSHSGLNRFSQWTVRTNVRVIDARCSTPARFTYAEFEGEDDEDLICVSPNKDFFIHSPQVNIQSNQKLDVISAYIGFDMKVMRYKLKKVI